MQLRVDVVLTYFSILSNAADTITRDAHYARTYPSFLSRATSASSREKSFRTSTKFDS